MMRDIVEQLRSADAIYGSLEKLHEQAADEIEQLREEMQRRSPCSHDAKEHEAQQAAVSPFYYNTPIADAKNAVLRELAKYFESGNQVPVERATIKASDFWRIYSAAMQKGGADEREQLTPNDQGKRQADGLPADCPT